MAQLLEQILHNQEHASLFLTHGGLDALLELVLHCVYPGGMSLLHHLSCVSASAAMLHSTTANMVANHVRGLAANADGARCIKALVRHLDGELDDLAGIASSMQPMDDDGSDCEDDEDEEDNPFRRILSSVPAVPIYELETNPANSTMTSGLASLYQSVLRVDWLSQNLGFAIKSCQQRSGNEFSLLSSERNAAWRSELEGTEFRGVVDAMSRLHRSALREVCRVRTEVGFDERDMRLRRSRPPEGIIYRFRIVCQEGAIVRDGIDIDRCENVGGLEMGEVVSAADRCINASGILRYRTDRGWVSEYTRGHGRENIAEVISVSLSDGDSSQDDSPYAWRQDRDGGMGRVECGIPDLRSASASLLSRLHAGQAALFGSIRRAITGGVRPPLRRSGGNTTIRPNVFASSELLATNLKANFSPVDGDEDIRADGCMYLGNQLALLLVALGEERDGLSRTQRQVGSLNMPLLINLLANSPGGWTEGIVVNATDDDGSPEEDVKPVAEREVPAFLQAVRAVLSYGLADAARLAAEENAGTVAMDTDEKKDDQAEIDAGPQRLSRAVASSLPSALALLRRLAAFPLVDTASVSWLSQMKDKDAVRLLGLPELAKGKTVEFDASQFTRAVQMEVGKVALDVVGDGKLAKGAPSNILHPLLCVLGDVLRSLEEAAKVTEPPPSAHDVGNSISLPVGASIRDILPGSRGGRMLRAMGLLPGGPDDEGGGDVEDEEPPFEPSEEAITQLAEMGFGRDHAEEALDAVGTNRVEVAMEYMVRFSSMICVFLKMSMLVNR
ncbi:hypothetical protein THAOC_01643 [Thalassiosira oceanica]|uniref:UBA domain-containing protein n=1 Tax=Thalassiosira oceanica TaxID=159749 RepID=K0TMW7_THAOC|nr:hypothetical protein THAOC_01643 [Thalassiosira oceanica]|eukprot:EJK76586.1 hypothetical protein THAOC_01643 [Thalassiosira oceanica]